MNPKSTDPLARHLAQVEEERTKRIMQQQDASLKVLKILNEGLKKMNKSLED